MPPPPKGAVPLTVIFAVYSSYVIPLSTVVLLVIVLVMKCAGSLVSISKSFALIMQRNRV